MRNAVSSPTAGMPLLRENQCTRLWVHLFDGIRGKLPWRDLGHMLAAASVRLTSPPPGRPPTAPIARQHSLPSQSTKLKPGTLPGTLTLSTTLKPGATLSRNGSTQNLSATARRQRNLATAERARVRLQCLHQVGTSLRGLRGKAGG